MVKSLAAIALALVLLLGISNVNSVSSTEGKQIVDTAIKNALISYYAINGIYPDNFNTLKEFANLSINEEKYHVFYEVSASNLMPSVDVIDMFESNNSGKRKFFLSLNAGG